MFKLNSKRPSKIHILLFAVTLCVMHSKRGRTDEVHRTPTGWQLGAAVGMVDFVSPERSASSITNSRLGSVLDVFGVYKPFHFLGVGCRGEFLFVPSKQSDAETTFGARTMLMLRFFLSVRKIDLHIGPEAGYTFLGRKADFQNAGHITFQGATVGLSLGADTPVTDSVSLGGIARGNYVLGSLSCTDRQCFIPHKGRNPGPSLFFGISGSFAL